MHRLTLATLLLVVPLFGCSQENGGAPAPGTASAPESASQPDSATDAAPAAQTESPPSASAPDGEETAESPASDDTADDGEVTAESPASDDTADDGEVTVRIVKPADYRNVLKQHRGKVVLVDFWATWCIPCRKQFPHTVAMSREYSNEDFAAISVSLDDPDDKANVLEFLQKQGATFDNLLSEFGGGAESFEAYDITNGALPHYKVYDRNGELQKTFGVDPLAEEQFTSEDIEHAVEHLLADSDSSSS